MTEHLFCWCGHPITVEDVPAAQGEYQIYSDGNTGSIIERCPGCEDLLDLSRLLPDPPPERPSDSNPYKEA